MFHQAKLRPQKSPTKSLQTLQRFGAAKHAVQLCRKSKV
jgi:hypothetical protein